MREVNMPWSWNTPVTWQQVLKIKQQSMLFVTELPFRKTLEDFAPMPILAGLHHLSVLFKSLLKNKTASRCGHAMDKVYTDFVVL